MKIFLLSVLAALSASAQVVFVDMANLVQRHPRTATDKVELEKRFREMETEVEGLRTDLDKMNAEFETAVQEAQNPALSAKAKKTAEDTAKDKRERLVERDRQASSRINFLRTELSKQEEGYLNRTTSDIRGVIEIVAKKKGYKTVLPKTVAVYMEPGLDITAEIAKEMGLPDEVPVATPAAAK